MTKKPLLDAGEIKFAEHRPVTLDEIQDTGIPDIEAISGKDAQELAALAREEAFMNEFVTVQFHAPSDPNQPTFVPIRAGDLMVSVPRDGRPYVIKRKYVEVVARAKMTRYSQVRRVLANGEEIVENVPHTALTYPFSVLEDKNPRGRAWLEKVLSDPA